MKKIISIAVAMVAGSVFANVQVARIFSDNMVLQRDKVVPVWGWADPGEEVTVAFAGQSVTAKADAHGNWEAKLQPLSVSTEPRDLVISGQTFHNVLVGDVWLCSGQSNMEMSFMLGIYDGKEFMQEAVEKFDLIRCVKVTKKRNHFAQRDVPLDHLWQSPKTQKDGIYWWTATGYFFARKLNLETGIPIGIIEDAWSGCQIEPFIATCGYTNYTTKNPRYTKTLDTVQASIRALDMSTEAGKSTFLRYSEAMKKYLAAADSFVAAGELPQGDIPRLPDLAPTSQYNAMIAPLVRFPIAGTIWYQGCSNSSDGSTYTDKMIQLVKGWREMWGYDFPFYYVQLASVTFTKKNVDPVGGDGYACIRDAQRLALKYIDKSGMAVAIDVGNDKDIHPKAKIFVGERLAAWALRDVYGKKVCPSGPLFKSADGLGTDKVTIHFDYAEGGLSAGEKNNLDNSPVKLLEDAKLVGFAVETANNVWEWGDAKIDGESVVITAGGKNIQNVRYGYRASATGLANLYNKAAAFPASPFSTTNQW